MRATCVSTTTLLGWCSAEWQCWRSCALPRDAVVGLSRGISPRNRRERSRSADNTFALLLKKLGVMLRQFLLAGGGETSTRGHLRTCPG